MKSNCVMIAVAAALAIATPALAAPPEVENYCWIRRANRHSWVVARGKPSLQTA